MFCNLKIVYVTFNNMTESNTDILNGTELMYIESNIKNSKIRYILQNILKVDKLH